MINNYLYYYRNNVLKKMFKIEAAIYFRLLLTINNDALLTSSFGLWKLLSIINKYKFHKEAYFKCATSSWLRETFIIYRP